MYGVVVSFVFVPLPRPSISNFFRVSSDEWSKDKFDFNMLYAVREDLTTFLGSKWMGGKSIVCISGGKMITYNQRGRYMVDTS